MDKNRPWWQDSEQLAWAVMTTIMVCVCSLLITCTYLMIRWML